MDRNVLINKQFKQYNKTSRYTKFPIYYHKNDEKYVYGTTTHLRDDTPYRLYTIQKNDTLDLLALKFYNNPTYYWIICDFNRIPDPYVDLIEGESIKIPSMSTLMFQ